MLCAHLIDVTRARYAPAMNCATRIQVDLPGWVLDEAERAGRMGSVEERMHLVNVLAGRNFREGSGGPFAAAVFDLESGELVSAGVNLVLSSQLSSMHAEVVALSLAQTRLASWDLSTRPHQLVVNWRPCAMCYGASIWSGVRDLVIAGAGAVVEQITGFNEGPMREDWREQAEARGMSVTEGIGYDDAIAVFQDYADSGAEVYNPRRG